MCVLQTSAKLLKYILVTLASSAIALVANGTLNGTLQRLTNFSSTSVLEFRHQDLLQLES